MKEILKAQHHTNEYPMKRRLELRLEKRARFHMVEEKMESKRGEKVRVVTASRLHLEQLRVVDIRVDWCSRRPVD